MPFYNTGAPTPSSKNTINSIAVTYGIRDFLLTKNLSPVYPTAFNNSPGTVKIGEPILDTMVGTGNVTQPFGLPLETEGILRWEIATILNKYKDTSSQAGVLQNIDFISPTPNPFPNTTAPNGVNNYPETIPQYGLSEKTVEAGYRKKATIKNLYLDADKQVDAADWITLEVTPASQQIKGYLDTYGGLNLGDSSAIQASSVIGSVLNGQGLGLAKGGVVTNYDIRASLAGRVLGSVGLINDTKLGMVGAQQLALSLANNAAFNVQQAALGALNVQDNVLSLVKNGTLAGFRPNYQITVPSGTGGRIADYSSRILGFTLPKSYLDDAGSIFLSESDSANIERANAMILNTGKGQVQALISNIFANINGTTVHDSPDVSHFRSGYAPGFTDNKGRPAINPSIYAFTGISNGTVYNFITSGLAPIPEINWNRSAMVENSGFKDFGDTYFQSKIKTPTFSWGSATGGNVNSLNQYTPYNGDKKSLLAKTQKLFNTNGMLNIVSKKGYVKGLEPSQIETAIVSNGMSKGSAVLTSDNFTADGYLVSKPDSNENMFCRSWTTFERYEKVKNLVRHSGLKTDVPFRSQMNGSVLDDNGFPIIAPYTTPVDPKRFMFSIENLAWSDRVSELAQCEIGPGDLLTGKKGRIMWFPPYGINFNESSSVSWESTNFIGRGEPVYTYNNTERTGSLSFQIIVDHPTYVNSFRGNKGPDNEYVASFFAGCVTTDAKFAEKLTVSEISEIETANSTSPQQIVDTPQEVPTKEAIKVYYPNDIYDYDSTYEDGLCNNVVIDYSVNPDGTGCTTTRAGQITSNTSWTDRYDYALNSFKNEIKINGIEQPFSGFNDTNLLSQLDTYLNEKCPNCRVIVKGFASVQGSLQYNKQLAMNRANKMVEVLKTKIHTKNKQYHDKLFKAISGNEDDTAVCPKGKDNPTDLIGCKKARRVEITFEYDPTAVPKKENEAKPVTKTETRRISKRITNKFYTECSYFDKLTQEDYFVFDKFREKIKYFHPAFHSTTPEGLNSRLTFLQQCTRQGPTLEKQGAHNLAFGRAPVCILRIGDFYNTKIVIDNMSIDYEPLVWDLNPEGIGVQPMIANVTLSFKFLGGSSLMGPINKLQNALSFNYYANTHVYDPRADYISAEKPVNLKDEDGNPIKVKDSISGYYIKNDFVEVYERKMTSDVEVTNEEIISNTPSQNQIENNDKANSGPAPDSPAPNSSVDDFEKITPYNATNTGNNIKLTFNLSQTLNADQEFKATIMNISKEIGVGKLTTTGANIQSFEFVDSGVGLEKDKTYDIFAVFNGDSAKRKTFRLTFKA